MGIFHKDVKFHGIIHDFVRQFLLKQLLSLAVARPGMSHGFLLTSQTSTPRLTPPGSPPILSASVSPTRTSKPASPRRNAMSFSTSRGMLDERSSIFSSLPPGHHGSISSAESGSHTGKPTGIKLCTQFHGSRICLKHALVLMHFVEGLWSYVYERSVIAIWV